VPRPWSARADVADDADAGAEGVAGEVGDRTVLDLDHAERSRVRAGVHRLVFCEPPGLGDRFLARESARARRIRSRLRG